MADLYSVIQGIEPDQQDIIEAELLARQILSSKYPDLDLREGTAVRDLAIRPSAFILALVKKGLNYYFSQNTIAGIDNSTSEEIVDGLLGNLFLTRNSGTYAVINARLYFAQQKTVSISSGTSFSTDGSLLFYPAASLAIPEAALQYDSYADEWYVDIDLVASDKGEDYNLTSGSLLYFSNFDPYFLHAEINYLSQKSTAAETNLEFISRSSSAISTRNLINIPSVTSRLQQAFNYLDKLEISGMGSSSMYRDQALVNGKRGVSRTANSAEMTDSDLTLTINLPAHGFIVGQTVEIVEEGGALVLRYVNVSQIVDINTFKVWIGFSAPHHTMGTTYVTAIDPDMWVHQGGCVDVYCGNEILVAQEQFTANSDGVITISGPSYKWFRVAGADDTIPNGTPYTIKFQGQVSRADASFSQDSDGVVTCTLIGHCLVEGRNVKVVGWPNTTSSNVWRVSSVLDGNTFELGKKSIFSIGTGLTPLIYYTDPYTDTGFSTRQNMYLDFGSSYAGGIASFRVTRFDKVPAVQAYLDSPENRVLCADYLARGFDISVVNLSLVTYAESAPLSGTISSLTSEYLQSLTPGEPLVVSDLVAKLVDNGVPSLQLPVTVTVNSYNKDMLGPINYTVTDQLTPASTESTFIVGAVSITQATQPAAP